MVQVKFYPLFCLFDHIGADAMISKKHQADNGCSRMAGMTMLTVDMMAVNGAPASLVVRDSPGMQVSYVMKY